MALKKDYSTDERVIEMAAMYRQGLTLAVIGDQYGITRERVRQLLNKAGVGADDGGSHVVARLKGESKQRKRDALCLAKWGLTFAEMKPLRANNATRAYASQRAHSRNRGIEFTLSLADWWAVWSASGRWEQRGRGKGSYCMSRINDAGGYTVGNVCIKLCTENSREATKQWIGKTKEHRGVHNLYPGSSRPYVVKVRKKQIGRFASIEEAVAARLKYLAEVGLSKTTLGGGRGWTYVANRKSRPYYMQCAGARSKAFATAEEAEAAYAIAVAARTQQVRHGA